MKFYIKTTLNDEYIINILTMIIVRDDIQIIDIEHHTYYFPVTSLLECRMCA